MVREEDLLWKERDSGLTFMHILTASPHILCYRDVMDGPSIATLSIVPFFAETSKASLKIPHSHSRRLIIFVALIYHQQDARTRSDSGST